MSPAPIAVSRSGRTGVVELARPEKFNCLSTATLRALQAALAGFESDPEVRALLIRSQGPHFCTGAELDEVQALRGDAGALRAFIALGHDVLNALEDSRLPVVVAVQGLCLAGGLELMMACDVAFAARSARFGDQHARFGLVPGWGGSQRLPRLVGERRALDLFLDARWIAAERAEAIGLVSQVVDDDALADASLAYCTGLAARSAPGLALVKRLARTAGRAAQREGLAIEIDAAVAALMSPDVAEGLAAFRARRPPAFG